MKSGSDTGSEREGKGAARVLVCACGLEAEARIARKAGFEAVVGGGDRERLSALLEEAAPRARWLLSFGLAGALSPELRPGDLVLAAQVLEEDRSWRCEKAPLPALAEAIGARPGAVFASNAILATAAEKARVGKGTEALAVDLESALVAASAAAAGIPFLVLRAIADPQAFDLPPAALLPLRAGGRPDLGPILFELCRRPRQIGPLFFLARSALRALRALSSSARPLRSGLLNG